MTHATHRLVLIGGCVLAFGAAYINTGFLVQTGVSVSHLTGDVSRLAVNLVSGQPGHFVYAGSVLLAALGFIGGATLSGYLLHHPHLEMRKPYGTILAASGCMLIGAHFAMARSLPVSICASGMVCGIQNALASRYRGLVLRTTHVTGLFTDMGISLGMRLRGHRVETWKIVVPLLLACAFLAGGVLCALSMVIQLPWLLVSGIGYLIGGTLWALFTATLRE